MIFLKKMKVLNNARIVCDKTKKDFNGFVILQEGKILEVSSGDYSSSVYANSEAEEVINCQNHILSAGLIDIQVHFRDPGQPQKEDVATGSLSAVTGGITTVVCQPNTKPSLDSTSTLNYLQEQAKQHSLCNILAYACVTNSLEGVNLCDLEELAKHEIVCGFTDDGLPVMNAHIMRQALEFSAKSGLVVSQHAEDLNLTNKGVINEGNISRKLNLKGIPNASESIIVQRDIELLRAFGGKYHVLHVSTK